MCVHRIYLLSKRSVYFFSSVSEILTSNMKHLVVKFYGTGSQIDGFGNVKLLKPT
jgi:hypothetical protein